MKRKILTIAALTAGVLLIAGCAKKEAGRKGNGITAWGDEKASEVPVTERAKTTEVSETIEKDDLATKKEEQARPKTGKGTFDGWADSSSVEIKMSQGDYQTFFVEDDKVKEALNQKGEGSEIVFTYGAVEGQVNKKIVTIE